MEYINLFEKLGEIGKVLQETYREKLLRGNISQSGTLYDSVSYRLEVSGDETNLFFQAESYYINIEEGRAPNSKMPPIDEIRKWMIGRGLPNKSSTAFLIARSIGRKGIKPNPILRESVLELKVYEKELKKALELDIQSYVDANIKGKIQIN